ncbi:MAG: manganese-dependent inorganic pyrophosphatase [Candidatus Woesearchaeota archaeon]
MARIVIGHTNPDTDSIGSAILLAHLETALGRPTQPHALGEPNEETRYVLERFGLETPEVITSVGDADVLIVDHTERSQAPEDLLADQIVGIVDHHKLGDIQTTNPPSVIIAPLGSTATILTQLYDQYDVEMTDALKGLALSCILSDTVILRSPTTTEEDQDVANALAEDLGIDLIELGRAQFEAKANISSKEPAQVLGIDMKAYGMGSKRIAIAQVEVAEPSIVLDRRDDYLEAMKHACESEGYDSFVFLVTDILEEGTHVLVNGLENEISEALGQGFVAGLMSRKKQVVPPLEKRFA